MPTDPLALRGDAPLLDAWLRFHEAAADAVHHSRPQAAARPGRRRGGRRRTAVRRAGHHEALPRCPRRRRGAGGPAVGRRRLPVLRRRRHARQPGVALALGGRRRPGGGEPHPAPLAAARAGARRAHAGVGAARGRRRRPGCRSASRRRPSLAALDEHPDVRAVLVGDPSYVGTVGDVAGLADVAHAHGPRGAARRRRGVGGALRVPSRPAAARARSSAPTRWSSAPTRPCRPGARRALVLARTDRIDAARLDAGVEATATTSPAGAILASIDAARALLERDGEALLGAALAATRRARERLAAVDGLVVLDGPASTRSSSPLVLNGTGADGIAVEQDLLAAGTPGRGRRARPARRGGHRWPTPSRSLERLVDAVVASIERHRGAPRPRPGRRGLRRRRRSPSCRRGTPSSPSTRRCRAPRPSAGSAPSSSRRTLPASRSSHPARWSPPTPWPSCGGQERRGADRLRRRPVAGHAARRRLVARRRHTVNLDTVGWRPDLLLASQRLPTRSRTRVRTLSR